ncbi:SPRY domain-containing protein [Lysinibacillus sp. NPDC093210]|uniref:SPRY domain-containing protein n=1 Tax=Lysinibacillus sp. NPDC093210 TaxID=3364133 RepID=UPI00381738C2
MTIEKVIWNIDDTDSGLTITDDLSISFTGSNTYRGAKANIGRKSGKWYFEFLIKGVSSYINAIGVATRTQALTGFDNASGFTATRAYGNNASKLSPYTTGYGVTYTTGDTIGVSLDLDNKTIEFSRNGISQGVAFTNLGDDTWFPYVVGINTDFKITANFGATPFIYPIPQGYEPYVGKTIVRLLLKNNNTFYSLSDKTIVHLPNSSTQNIVLWGIEKDTEIHLDVPFTKQNYPNDLSSFGNNIEDRIVSSQTIKKPKKIILKI